MSKYTANQDIRDCMADHCVTQKMLAESMGVSSVTICKMLKTELSQKDKENILHHIDAIEADRNCSEEDAEVDDCSKEAEVHQKDSTWEISTKFQIGDRVKIPSKSLIIGTVRDIWQSLSKKVVVYSVATEDGRCSLYEENHLEPAPLPIEYRFEAHVENNVAVVSMIATQGEKTWVYARGHAHILHDGEVGMAQAVSYASKRMFESLDTKNGNRIYFKDRKDTEEC